MHACLKFTGQDWGAGTHLCMEKPSDHTQELHQTIGNVGWALTQRLVLCYYGWHKDWYYVTRDDTIIPASGRRGVIRAVSVLCSLSTSFLSSVAGSRTGWGHSPLTERGELGRSAQTDRGRPNCQCMVIGGTVYLYTLLCPYTQVTSQCLRLLTLYTLLCPYEPREYP